ncbi:lysostaphin resistance A-like protein [Micrococcus sp.]|uniref:CPBP family intramembrane glutamic endopeptidase n=1 Tax=Micrococcus sp. TaxID=1271 RepID=UPI002A90BF55|nr:lysostaphin resistance A-like protein [Micrococcus sp.]MDY6055011.1 lysostaphin resistance A-like protein [Micrococcus sp.]
MSVPPSAPQDDAVPSSASDRAPQGWPPPGWPTRADRRAARRGPDAPPAGTPVGTTVPAGTPVGTIPAGAPAGTAPASPPPAGWPPSGWPGRAAARTAPDWTPGPFRWADALVVVVYVAIMVVGLGLLLASALGLVPSDLDAFTPADEFTVNAVGYAILVALVLAVAWRPLVTSLRVFRTGTWWKLLLLPGLWFACIVVNVVVLSLVGEAQTSANQAALEEMTTQVPAVGMALLTVVGAPLVEEYLFRHLLVGKLSRHMNVWVCAVLSVMAFTLLHFLGTGFRFDPVEMVPYLTLAVAITVSYVLLGRSLAWAVALHMVNNGIAILVIYLVRPLLEDSGPQPVTPAVLLPALESGARALGLVA